MDIKTFVSESLTQILQGVEQAQANCKEGSVINPASGSNLVDMKQVEFDIAVTVEKGSETKGGIAVFGGVINLGSQGQSKDSNTSVSRIKFSVPIKFQLARHSPSYKPK